MLQERRRFIRTNSCIGVDYTILPFGDPEKTVSKDLASGGIRLVLRKALPPGTQLQLSVQLPEKQASIHCTAEVVNNEQMQIMDKAGQRQLVTVGARFIEIAPEDEQALSQHIALSFRSQQNV